MCLICVELSKDKLTPLEARRNLGEMIDVVEEDHRIEVLQAIWKKEDELNRLNEDAYEDEEQDSSPSESDDWFWGEDWMFNPGSD